MVDELSGLGLAAGDGRAKKSQKTVMLRILVLAWFCNNGRDFPWRSTTNPYHIYVAEVLLRQTQAERVLGPYLELIASYPDVKALASANVDDLRTWFKPLGLVKRADNLVKAAAVIAVEHKGNVPDDFDVLLTLPGIGLYSARAILCMGFNKSVPMIDESSGRLLRRVLAMIPQGPAYCDQWLLKRVAKIVPAEHAKEFNLGLLDIAAKHCRPIKSLCVSCPLRACCSYAHRLES